MDFVCCVHFPFSAIDKMGALCGRLLSGGDGSSNNSSDAGFAPAPQQATQRSVSGSEGVLPLIVTCAKKRAQTVSFAIVVAGSDCWTARATKILCLASG